MIRLNNLALEGRGTCGMLLILACLEFETCGIQPASGLLRCVIQNIPGNLPAELLDCTFELAVETSLSDALELFEYV